MRLHHAPASCARIARLHRAPASCACIVPLLLSHFANRGMQSLEFASMKTPSSPSKNILLVRGLYEAFAAGNVPAVLAAFDPHILWNEAENFPYADGNPYIGPEAVLHGVFARCVGEWDGFSVAIEELLDAGDTIVALGRYGGTCKATGRVQHTQLVHVWRVNGGKLVRFQQYADTLQVAKVMGKA